MYLTDTRRNVYLTGTTVRKSHVFLPVRSTHVRRNLIDVPYSLDESPDLEGNVVNKALRRLFVLR